MIKANEIKVKVYPKDLKSIPDILPFNKLINGDPMELELNKKEIQRCMNFGDVYDLTSDEEVLIDEYTYQDIVEFIEVEDEPSKDEKVVTKPNEDQKNNESATTPTETKKNNTTAKTVEETVI